MSASSCFIYGVYKMQAAARRRRFETQASIAFRWWRRTCQCNRLGKVAGQRRALRRWRRKAIDARLTRQATVEARGRYVRKLNLVVADDRGSSGACIAVFVLLMRYVLARFLGRGGGGEGGSGSLSLSPHRSAQPIPTYPRSVTRQGVYRRCVGDRRVNVGTFIDFCKHANIC